MDLDTKWEWSKRKLGCRVRPETGNPAGDELRERFAELVKVDVRDVLSEMNNTWKHLNEQERAEIRLNPKANNHERYLEIVKRSHVIGASEKALTEIEKLEKERLASANRNKAFMPLPKSPPRRILLNIHENRARPNSVLNLHSSKNEVTLKLEKKLAKQRRERMAIMEKSLQDEESAKSAANDSKKIAMSKDDIRQVMSPYHGDLFSTAGEYLESMLYMSRMKDSFNKSKAAADANGGADTKPQTAEGHDVTRGELKYVENQIAEKALDPSSQDNGAKLYCAASLCNWSRNSANASRLASEGAVRAIIDLTRENSPRIIMFCAAAFRYMSENLILANALLDEGALSTIMELATDAGSLDELIAGNLAITLVNLTRLNGREAQLVDAGIVLGLMDLVSIEPSVGSSCVRGLYNLTCVDNTYTLIERVIRALISLSSSSNNDIKHICAAALCNLADLKQVRARIVEEGVIAVLAGLVRGAEMRTRRVCAVVLQNLSASKSCRPEMVSRGCMGLAYGLVHSEQDPIILRCIALTISRLALEPINCSRIIKESGVTALCNIAVKYPTIPGITQPVALAFQLLAKYKNVRTIVVQEGGVTAMATFLRFSVDVYTLQHTLLALCHLLLDGDNHLPIVQQGLILTLITICEQDNETLKDFASLAFLNLSAAEDSRKHLVNAGAVPAIVKLSAIGSTITRLRCAAILSNVSEYETGMMRMVGDGIIEALVELVSVDDLSTVRYACTALCRICAGVAHGNRLIESGAVSNLVQRTLKGDNITKQFCGAVLSALSLHESCRMKLCELDVMSAMTSLASLGDDATRQRCLVAFANISCDDAAHELMVNHGVVSIISQLANSYQEMNYVCCAKTLCNLSCSKDLRVKIAEENGVQSLLMICLVQSVDIQTKLLCAIALYNLLDENTVGYMLETGLVAAIANMTKIHDERVFNTCCRIFNYLTFFNEGKDTIVSKAGYVSSLFTLLSAHNAETKVMCVRTVCNLLLSIVDSKSVAFNAINSGAMDVLYKSLQEVQDEAATLQSIQALFAACSDTDFTSLLTKRGLHILLAKHARSSTGAIFECTCKVLAMLSYATESRIGLQNMEFVTLLVSLIMENGGRGSIRWLTLTLLNVSLKYPDPKELIAIGVIDALQECLPDRGAPHPKAMGTIDEESVDFSNAEPHEISRRNIDLLNDKDYILIASCCSTILRLLLSSSDSMDKLASAKNVRLLRIAAEAALGDANSTVFYDAATCLAHFGFESSACRVATCTSDIFNIFDKISRFNNCAELCVWTLCVYLSDIKVRRSIGDVVVARTIFRLIELNPKDVNILNGAVSCILELTKLAGMRAVLNADPYDALTMVTKLSLIDDAKLKANCAKTMKGLAVLEEVEGIEEGTITSLIAMSLEGKKSRNKDEILRPETKPHSTKGVLPACGHEATEIEGPNWSLYWYAEKFTTKGGAAGAGPAAPAPPLFVEDDDRDGGSASAHLAEEIDSGEMEGRTKMAFAKMHVPQDVRNQYSLKEEDFELSELSPLADADQLEAAAEEKAWLDSRADEVTSPLSTSPSFADYQSVSDGADGDTNYEGGEEIASPLPAPSPGKDKSAKRVRIKKEKISEISIGYKAAQLGLYV